MNLPDYKALKKLADVCRKAGIKSFKNTEFEFTLTEDVPAPTYKRRVNKSVDAAPTTKANDIYQTDTLTEEQLLMWSALDPASESPKAEL